MTVASGHKLRCTPIEDEDCLDAETIGFDDPKGTFLVIVASGHKLRCTPVSDEAGRSAETCVFMAVARSRLMQPVLKRFATTFKTILICHIIGCNQF